MKMGKKTGKDTGKRKEEGAKKREDEGGEKNAAAVVDGTTTVSVIVRVSLRVL